VQGTVNVFETGSVRGDYAKVTLIRGDSGGLTYGRSQTTRNSGNLYLLLRDYCAAPGARFAEELRPYLSRMQKREAALDNDAKLKGYLRQAGEDAVMRSIQDSFFDRVYWQTAVAAAEKLGITTPLGMAVVYDSIIHGSWQKIASRTSQQVSFATAGEKAWVKKYLQVRRAWLLSCAMPLPNTVYRQDAFLKLIDNWNWDLDLPLTVRGCVISAKTLGIDENGWKLYLNEKLLGPTWQNEEDAFRNYFPVRTLLENLVGAEAVNVNLVFNGTACTWKGKPLSAPVVKRSDDKAWGQVRGLAGQFGLVVIRDEAARTITLKRA
jgi:chitosanase